MQPWNKKKWSQISLRLQKPPFAIINANLSTHAHAPHQTQWHVSPGRDTQALLTCTHAGITDLAGHFRRLSWDPIHALRETSGRFLHLKSYNRKSPWAVSTPQPLSRVRILALFWCIPSTSPFNLFYSITCLKQTLWSRSLIKPPHC